MKFNKIYLAFCLVAVALFFVGRCTAPKPVLIDNKHKIDSLTVVARAAHKRAIRSEDLARKAYERGINHQKAKVIVRTIYRRDTAINHAMNPAKKDSVIKEMLGVSVSDSSRFTNPVADGILDLGSENTALKASSAIDSTSIAELSGAYLQLDKAMNETDIASGAKDEIISEERKSNKQLRKEIRKQKVLKWLGVFGIFTVSTLAIINK